MSPREHGHYTATAECCSKTRPQVHSLTKTNVVAEHQRQENREYHDGGNIFLQQRNILRQVIQQFQQPPQLEMILENQRDVMHQLVQEAHRVRQEVKDIKNAMVNALQTVDNNHASHQQIIQAQTQYLQRLTAEQEAFKTAMQALSEANVRLNESMLAQERESETRKARLEVLERVIGEKLNDALLRVPAETQNLNERLTRIEEWGSQTQMDGRTVASIVDNHQEWQSQVEEKLTDLMTNQQLKEIKFNELLEANSRDSHSRNERLEDKLRKLEHQIETQRRQIVQLEAIPRMTKAELNTPEKEIGQRLFHDQGQGQSSQRGQSSQSHSQNDQKGGISTPPNSHSHNDKGETDCTALKETVSRLSFWILQITGALDLEENPDKVNFPNPKTCREIDKLSREIEALQEKCQECHSKDPGGDPSKIPTLEKGVNTLKQGLKVTMDRLDQFLSYQKKDNAKVREIQQALDVTRDELAAWAVHLQQQQQAAPWGNGENHNETEESRQAPITVLTEKASKGDIVIEVTDHDNYQIGKYIVIQESLIYLVEGKGSLILERPLCRDFLAGTQVRPLSDEDQYRTEDDGEIYLHNPLQPHSHNADHGNSTNSHSHNEGPGNSTDSHGHNGSGGNPGVMGLDGQGEEPALGNGANENNQLERLPCGKPKPPVERAGAPVKDLTLTTWLLRSHFQQVKEHWRQCHEYYMTYQPTSSQLDYDNRFKGTDVDKALEKVKFPPSTGSVLSVIQGIRDFEGQLVRAMKGLSQACVLYAKLLLHGVYKDLEKLQSKKTAAERQALVFNNATVEEQFMQTLESRVHAWLADHVPRDIQTKAANRTNALSARMLIVEYYYTSIPGPDTIGMNMSKSIRVPTNTATTGVEVLANIESWKTSIQINYEVTQTMPSQQEIRLAFQRLISPLKVADEGFKFHQDLLVSQAFGTQRISDEDVLKYFQQTEEKIHSMDTRKPLKFPDRSPPSKTNAINTPDNVQKPKSKANPRSQSVPPPKTGQQQKGSPQKKGEKGAGKSSEGKSQPKATPSPKAPSPTAANPPPPKTGGGTNSNRTEKRLPGTIKKQCVPYTLPSGCVNGNNCPFQHANDPVTKKPLAPSPEDVKRYQAALKRNPSLANPKQASSSSTNKPSGSVPTIRMIRVTAPEESEEEPEPEYSEPATEPPPRAPRTPANHPNPAGQIDLDEMTRQFSRLRQRDRVCDHMRRRSLFADIIFGGNQHGRWLNCRHCGIQGALQTLDLMSCVNCSLAHIYRPRHDPRRTCVWTRWLTMIARYRFRMTDAEKAVIQERILRCQERRRMRAVAAPLPVEEPQVQGEQSILSRPLSELTESELWERAVQEERLSLLAQHASQTRADEGTSSSSGSTQAPAREVIDVSHISASSPFIVTTRHWRGQTLPRGQAFQIHTRRTRLIRTGEYSSLKTVHLLNLKMITGFLP